MAKKSKSDVEEIPVPAEKISKKKEIAALVSTNDVVKGSFFIKGNILKLTVIDAAGGKMNTCLPLDRSVVDVILK